MGASEYNLLITGVGGQGILTLGRILSSIYNKYGYNVLIAETHGMSQRGGSVAIHVRIGEVYSPLIPLGGADTILSLDLIETFRYIGYANTDTLIISNSGMVRPGLPNIRMPRVEDLLSIARSNGLEIRLIDGSRIAREVGNPLSLNMAMLGALVASGRLPYNLDVRDFIDEISRLPQRESNLRAFEEGYSRYMRL